MSEEQKPQPQNDFFSDFMFGRRPLPPEPEKQDSADPEGKIKPEHSQAPELSQSEKAKQPDQLESIFALVQSLGPVIDKLAPLAVAVTSYLSQSKKEETKKSASKKNANE